MEDYKDQIREYYIKTLEFQNEVFKRDHILVKLQEDLDACVSSKKEIAELLNKAQNSSNKLNQATKENELLRSQLDSAIGETVRLEVQLDQTNNEVSRLKEQLNQANINLRLINEKLNEKDKLVTEYWDRIQSMRIKSRLKRIFGLKK